MVTTKYVIDGGLGLADGSSEANAYSPQDMEAQIATDYAAADADGLRYAIKGNVALPTGSGESINISGTSGTFAKRIYLTGYGSTLGDGVLSQWTGMGQQYSASLTVSDYYTLSNIHVEKTDLNSVAEIGTHGVLYRCRFINNQSNRGGAIGSSSTTNRLTAYLCDFKAYADGSATPGPALSASYGANVHLCRIAANHIPLNIGGFSDCVVANCLIHTLGSPGSNTKGIQVGTVSRRPNFIGNIIDGFDDGIYIGSIEQTSGNLVTAGRNIITNCVNGINLNATPFYPATLWGNAIHASTADLVNAVQSTAQLANLSLASDPFVDSANGDFTLLDSGEGTTLRALGFPIGALVDWDNLVLLPVVTTGGGSGGVPLIGSGGLVY